MSPRRMMDSPTQNSRKETLPLPSASSVVKNHLRRGSQSANAGMCVSMMATNDS